MAGLTRVIPAFVLAALIAAFWAGITIAADEKPWQLADTIGASLG